MTSWPPWQPTTATTPGSTTVTLTRHLGYTVPKGVVHRTRAAVKTVILMVEGATVTPTGDAAPTA